MNILLGIDMSPHATETVSQLCRMKCPEGSSVHVLSVVAATEPQFAPQPHVLAAVAGRLEMIEAQEMGFHQRLLDTTLETLRRAGFVVTGEIVHGDPRHVLVETAARRGVDLMVVGSHGGGGIGRALVGSVASWVVAHAPCNVMVVRRAETTPAG